MLRTQITIHILTLFRVKAGGEEGGGSGDPNFFLQISFSLVKMSLHVEFHPPELPGTGQKVCVVVGRGGGGGGGGV